jgi:hypothetical protein
MLEKNHFVSGFTITTHHWSAVSLTPATSDRRFQSRISQRIRIYMQKGFNPNIRGPDEVVGWKKPEVENLVTQSL